MIASAELSAGLRFIDAIAAGSAARCVAQLLTSVGIPRGIIADAAGLLLFSHFGHFALPLLALFLFSKLVAIGRVTPCAAPAARMEPVESAAAALTIGRAVAAIVTGAMVSVPEAWTRTAPVAVVVTLPSVMLPGHGLGLGRRVWVFGPAPGLDSRAGSAHPDELS